MTDSEKVTDGSERVFPARALQICHVVAMP